MISQLRFTLRLDGHFRLVFFIQDVSDFTKGNICHPPLHRL